jgi:hypothetical protein
MESSTALAHNFPYRPALLAGNEMHFNLTKNSNNILSLTDDYAGDTNSVMYDSTEPVKYYLAQKPNTKGSSNLQSSTLDVMSYVDSSAMRVGGWDDSTAEARGDSVDSTLGGYYAGPGQYDADLIWNSDNIDDSSDTATRVVVLSEKEWKQLYYNKLWLGENDLTAVTVT